MFKRLAILFIVFIFSWNASSYLQIVKADELNFQQDLQKDLAAYIKKQKGTITVHYVDLTSNKSYSYNGSNSASAASTLKLPQALYIMELAELGKINLNEQLTYRSYHHYGGSGIIQNEKVGSKYTIRELVKRSIIYSDNIAFIMLMEKVGKGNFINYMKKLGGTYAYPQGRSITSAKDLTLYASKLYSFSQNSEYGKELVKYLKSTIFNTTIPAGVKGVEIAHKVGMIPMNLIYNDIAIVYHDNPYALAVTTKNLEYTYSQKVIAEIASITHKNHMKKHQNLIAITTKILNKENQSFVTYNQNAKLVNGRLLVPIRETFEALGVNIKWDKNNKTVIASKNATTLSIPIQSKQIKINNKFTKIDAEAQIVDGNVLVPLRFISETFNAVVSWDQKGNTIVISNN